MGLLKWLTGAANRSAQNNKRSGGGGQKKKKQKQRQEPRRQREPSRSSQPKSSGRQTTRSGGSGGSRQTSRGSTQRQTSTFQPKTFQPKTFKPSATQTQTRYKSFQASNVAPRAFKASTAATNKKTDTKPKVKGAITKTTVGQTQRSEAHSVFEKPKNYNYKKDLQQAYKKGSKTTYLGTKQEEKTTSLMPKFKQKTLVTAQTAQATKSYYKTDDWKTTKKTLAKQTKKAWYKAARKAGYSDEEAKAWMNSEEGKKTIKDDYIAEKNRIKKSINKDIQKSVFKDVDETYNLKSVNALTKGQFDKMTTASRMGKKAGNKYLKNVGGEKLLEDIGSKTVEAGLRSKAAYGVMQGMSKADIWSGSVGKYNKAARTGMEQTKKSGAYLVGYGAGLAADMAMGGVASRGASLAKGTGELASKLVGKGVSKEAAKELARETGKLASKEGWKRFGMNRAGQLAAETPTNVLDAAKMSMDADGNVNKKEFRNWLLLNSAFTVGVGGAMEGVGAAATKKLGNKTVELIAKREAGTITKEESEKLAKNIQKLSKKSKGEVDTLSRDIADARMAKINADNAAKAKTVAEEEAKNVPKGFHGRGSRYTQSPQAKGARARANYAEKLAENEKRVANRAKMMADEQARTPGKATTEAEKKALAQASQRYSEGVASTTERARVNEVHRLQDELRTLREALPKAEAKSKSSGTMLAHAKAEARAEEIRNSIKIKENQLKNAQAETLSGRLGKAQAAVKREGTFASHEKAARTLEGVEAEIKADAEAKAKKLANAAKKAEAKAKADPSPANMARAEMAREAAEKAAEDAKPKTLADRYKEAGLPDYVAGRSPKEIKEYIEDTREAISAMEKDMKEAQRNQRRAFANGQSKDGYRYADQYNELKEEISRAKENLDQFTKADEINAKYAPKEAEAPKAEVPQAAKPPEGSPGKFTDEEAELASAGLAKEPPPEPPKIEPKEGQSHYEAFKESQGEELNKENHRKDLANRGKAEKETTGLKSAWKKFYSMFVSDLEPFERMAMSAATREERKRGRVTINGMLTARSKAMTKVREEGMGIFEKRGLHKNAEKAAAYDDYALLMHDLDRLKQKSIEVYRGDQKLMIDFGEGAIFKLQARGNASSKTEWVKEADLPDGNWKNWRNMSEEDIKKDIEKYVKDNDLDWDQIIHNKSFTGQSESEINTILRELEKTYGADIKKFQQELSAYHKDLLKEDFLGGIISKERYDKLIEKYPNYVPTFRDYKAIAARSFNEDFRAVNLYAAKGADHAANVIPQYTQMIAKTNAVMKRTAENEMLNTIAKINRIDMKDLPHGHTPDELMEVSSGVFRDANTGQHKIYFRQEGKGVSMPISEEAYHAIRQWSGTERAAIMEFKLAQNKLVRAGAKGLTEASRAFKALITDYSIIFGCRNFVRDSATALVYSEHPAQWLVNFPKAVMAIANKSSKYHAAMQQYIKDGGRYNALVTSTDLAKMPKLGKKEGIPGLRLIKDFNTTMETLPRMSEYISTVERLAKQNGISFEDALKNRKVVQEAMYNAKEVTLNFDRGGMYGRMLNRGFVPFFNPSIQGIDKLARFLVKDNKSMSEFMAMGAKMAGMVVAPTLAWEYFVNQDVHPGTGDKGMGDAYRKLSAYNKYAYFCIPMGKDDNGDWEFLKIPRAREMAAMQLPIDWFIQNVKWENRDGTANLFESGKQAVKLGIEQIGPVNPLTDNYFSPVWNLAHNKTWMGGQIEGYEDEAKRLRGEASDIYDSDTSSASVAIMSLVNSKQNAALKKLGINPDVTRWIKQHQVSPKQLDNMFDSYLGVIHDMAIRPFSQQGASLEAVKNNPAEETAQWAKSTFGTAFIVNGTLSSQRKSGMYANLYDKKSKLEDYPKGSKEYIEADMELKKFQNNCVYDVQSLDGAIDAINKSKKYTGKQKAELTKALKREQNNIIDNYNEGKGKIYDPLDVCLKLKDENGKRVFSDDYVFTKLTYTSDNGKNAVAESWNAFKSTEAYQKSPKKAVKQYKEITLQTRQMAGKMGDSKSFVDYASVAVACTDKKAKSGKNYDAVLDAYNINDSKRKAADVYVNEMGGSADTYVGSHRHIVEGAAKLGKFPKDLKDHEYAMILANARTKNGNPLRDRAYWIEDNPYGSNSYAMQRMNYARCLSSEKYSESKWSYRKVSKFADKYGLDYKSSDEDIVKAIEATYPKKTKEEKAALFGVIKPTDENPYGEIGDYSVDGDSGYEADKKGHGRRRRGRRGRRGGHGGGGGGGGGGTPFTPEVNTAGKNAKVTATKVTDTAARVKAKKSNLNDAYRKKVKKLREETRSIK